MGERVYIKARKRRRKPCFFCMNKMKNIDYKNIDVIARFVTDRGKIYPKRNSFLCAKHQRKFAEAVKRARHVGLVPYCVD